MKNTLIFAGLMVFVTTCGAFAFSNAADNGGTGNFSTFSTATNTTYPDTVKDSKIRVATTNYVAARVTGVTGRVTDLTNLADSDSTVVGNAGTSGLSKVLKEMGGGTCGSGGTCDGEDGGGTDNNPKLNTAKTVNPSNGTMDSSNSYSTRCTGTVTSGGTQYGIAACGYIKSGNNRQWIQIVGGAS